MASRLISQVKTVMQPHFHNGLRMPPIGLGTKEAEDPAVLEATLNSALDIGYRHIDTAYLHKNEAIIGKVVNQWISSGKIKRDDIFITTKLPPWGFHRDKVDTYMMRSLENLDLDYVDLYLIQFPVGVAASTKLEPLPHDHRGVWQSMEKQVEARRAKSIGLSHFSARQIDNVLKFSRIKPACNQIEVHVYLHQTRLVKYCQDRGITVVACSPLRNPGYNEVLKRKGLPEKLQLSVLTHPLITYLAIKYKKTHAQIALRFLLQKDIIVIPKTVHPIRLEENFNLFNFEIEDNDMETLKGLDSDKFGRLFDWTFINNVREHPDYPFA